MNRPDASLIAAPLRTTHNAICLVLSGEGESKVGEREELG
jgi:hypothetical protein